MRTSAAVLWATGSPWTIEDVDLDAPRDHEVLVEIHASGLCHSQDHIRTGDLPWQLPVIGGHEGAGVVLETGASVSKLAVGDHILLSYIPACGRCESCASGHSYHCDRGGEMTNGRQITDGTSRHHAHGEDLGIECNIGTFARHTVVHEDSCIAIDRDIPLRLACLLGCSVPTGWGSVANVAGVGVGDSLAVVGIGGVGANAVQAGSQIGLLHVFAIDPVDLKREMAEELGATRTFASLADAFEPVAEVTRGRMCDAVVMTMGVGDGALVADAAAITAKRGRVVITNLHPASESTVRLNLLDLTLMGKQVVGSVVGASNLHLDVPRFIELYHTGRLDLERLVTTTYSLHQVNEGYADMHAGRNIRGVLLMDRARPT